MTDDDLIKRQSAEFARLAEYIMHNVPGEPSESEGAVDTAIRIMQRQSAELAALQAEVGRLREVVHVIASQAQAHEMDSDTRDGADFDEAYDLIIHTARAALKDTRYAE